MCEHTIWPIGLLCGLIGSLCGILIRAASASPSASGVRPVSTLPSPGRPVHIPLLLVDDGYAALPPHDYGSLTVFSAPADRPAEAHPDLCLALRGYAPVDAEKSLIDYNGSTDAAAPRLSGLLGSALEPSVSQVYAVHEWDWTLNAPAGLITVPPVTLIGLETTPGQQIHVPASGYDIGEGYTALVLYASDSRATLKYTREDNVILGYSVHLEHLVVHPALMALYEACDAAGRDVLPAVCGNELLGTARGTELGVAIRDCGAFMDPRSRKDWW